ncbi:hypothetical protein ACFRR6_01970 [Streptomyces sp. NPDC056891]|uniref:hypothetical protein n=1 Tax=Streptomyces sp. NPDC056891 TaxID=3345961 RepID=UPI0036C9CFFC
MTHVLTLLTKLVAPLARRGLPRLALSVMALTGSAAALTVASTALMAGRSLVAVLPDAGTGATAALLGLLTVVTVAAALLAMAGKVALAVFAVFTPCAACADLAARYRAAPRRAPARPVTRQVPRGGP